jgi:hypothetical protein
MKIIVGVHLVLSDDLQRGRQHMIFFIGSNMLLDTSADSSCLLVLVWKEDGLSGTA